MESGSNRQNNDQNNQFIQKKRNKRIKLHTRDSFQQVDDLNNNNENYVEHNQPSTSRFGMDLVLNKLRPYLSLPDDENNLIIRLNSLGVKCIDDLLLLHFENDLQGIINVIQCRKLQQELLNDFSKQYVNTPLVKPNKSIPLATEHVPWIQFNAASKTPQFTSSVIKSLEKGPVSYDCQLEIVETLSKYMFDAIENPGIRECRKIVSLLEKQFPNGFRNTSKESRFNVEYISKQVVQRIYYLKRKKKQLEPKQNDLLPQNDCASSKISKQKKLKFGTHPDRYLPVDPEEGQMFSVGEQTKIYLKSIFIIFYVTKLENIENMKWTYIINFMRNTYAAQRKMITNSEPITKILGDWPFLGKPMFLKYHFSYLTNKDETVFKKFQFNISLLLKFVQSEAKREQKDIDLQMRLKAITRKNNKQNINNSLLIIILSCMAIMKENFERMFIIFDDSISVDELQANAKIISTPVVACLGDIWSNPKCFVFVDKHCLWNEPMPIIEAIQIMFMSYYVFNILYPKELSGILQFLQRFAFKINDESNRVEKRPLGEQYVPKLHKLMYCYINYCDEHCTC